MQVPQMFTLFNHTCPQGHHSSCPEAGWVGLIRRKVGLVRLLLALILLLFQCCCHQKVPERNTTFSKVKKEKLKAAHGWIFDNCAKVSSANPSTTLITASVIPSFPQYWKPNLVRSCLASDCIAAPSYTAYFHPKCTFKTTRFALFSQLSDSRINPHSSNSLYCEMCWNKIKGRVQKPSHGKNL